MNYYIIAGEASGDLHGGNLIRQLRLEDGQAEIRCWGGDLMQQAGATLVKHYRELAFMGFVEVLMNLPVILRNLDFCKKDILQFRPDALILIDYPGFNLRMAKWAHARGFKVIYYISPQIWAWKESRVHTIKRCVDKMLVILPFEKEFYAKWDYEVEYVGHPLEEVVKNELQVAPARWRTPSEGGSLPVDKPVIALLPGSRRQEVSKKLPVMLQMTEYFPEYRFVIAQAPSLEDEFLQSLTGDNKQVLRVKNNTYELLKKAKAALVTSGTATLETALFGVPEVVCYRSSRVSYFLAKRLIKVKYISLVNLIMDKEVVKELIQQHFTVKNLQRELSRILTDAGKIAEIKTDYAALWKKLGDGNASQRAARSIVEFLRKQED